MSGAVKMPKATIEALASVALRLAIVAPERFSKYGYTTCVPRRDIKRARELLDECGVNWRALKRERAARLAGQGGAS